MGQLSNLPVDPATNGGFTPVPYVLTEPVSALSSVPRVTASRCTEDLFGESALRNEYLTGLLSGTVFVMIVFLIWTLVLLVLKCLGPRRVGCASGTPVRPSKPGASSLRPSKSKPLNPYDEGADEEFLAAEAEAARKKKIGNEIDGETIGGADGDAGGVYEAAHMARYGEDKGGTYTTADYKGMSGGLDFDFDDTVVSELAFGDEAGMPGKNGRMVAPDPPGSKHDDDGEVLEDDFGEAVAEWERKTRRHERRMVFTRVFFLFCGCAVMASSALFYYKGMWGLAQTFGSVQDGIENAEKVIWQAHNVTEQFLSSSRLVRQERESLQRTRAACPELVPQQQPPPLLNVTLPGNVTPGLDGAGEGALDELANWQTAIRAAFQNASRLVDNVGDQLLATATDLQNGLEDAAVQADNLQKNLSDLSWLYWLALSITITVNVLIVLLMTNVVAAWCGWGYNASCLVRCLRNAVCMPTFLLLVFLSWTFASVFMLAGVAMADFCVAPDVHISTILGNLRNDALLAANGGGQDDVADFSVTVVYDLALYYVRQCRARDYPEDVYDDISAFAGLVGAAADGFHDVLESVANAPPGGGLPEICGADGVATDISNGAAVLHAQLHVVWDALVGALGLLACSNFNPIYNSISHDAVCVNGQSAMAWIFATSLCIAVFSMTMVSLRSAWYIALTDMEELDEHIAKIDIAAHRRKERREKCCSYILWAMLVGLMIAALIVSVYYGLNGFQGQPQQCPAEQQQFSPWSPPVNIGSAEGTPGSRPIITPTPMPTISARPTVAPTTAAPEASPTPSPLNGTIDAPTDVVVPECKGKRSVLHRIVFEGLEGEAPDGDGLDGLNFTVRAEGAGPGNFETVYSTPFESAGAKEHFICLLRQKCYRAVLSDGVVDLTEGDDFDWSWEIQQADPAAPDAADEPPITIASGGLGAASGDGCTFTVPLKDSSRRPVCPTTCTANEEDLSLPNCTPKRLSALHELAFLPSGEETSVPDELRDATVEISTELRSGESKVISTVRVADFDPDSQEPTAKSSFCIRRDRCYTANVVFPPGSLIDDGGSSARWVVRKVLAGTGAGSNVGPTIASGVIAPNVVQGPGEDDSCTFALKGRNGAAPVCPSTCTAGREGDNIFNESSPKSSADGPACNGRKNVLHEVFLAGENSAGSGASLTIRQAGTNAQVFSKPLASMGEAKHYVCLKRQQCYSASIVGDSTAEGSESRWMIQEAESTAGQSPIVIASGGLDSTEGCSFTVIPKNPSNQPSCGTTLATCGTPGDGTQRFFDERSSTDLHQHQSHAGLVRTRAFDNNGAGHEQQHRSHWSPH